MYTGRTLRRLSNLFNTPNFTNRSTISFVLPTPLFPRKSAICLKVGLHPHFFQNSSTTKNTSLCAGLISTSIHFSNVTLGRRAISRFIFNLVVTLPPDLKKFSFSKNIPPTLNHSVLPRGVFPDSSSSKLVTELEGGGS